MPKVNMPRHADHPVRPPVRLPTIDALSNPDALAAVVGPVASIERSPLVTLGYTYTGNTLERLDLRLASGGRRTLVLKRTMLNWVARRSGDAVGREAALLAEPALTGVWEVLGCPYRAFAAHGGDAGLLMDDLSDHLLPDIDEPNRVADETLLPPGRIPCRYWESECCASWLAHLRSVLRSLARWPRSRRLGGPTRCLLRRCTPWLGDGILPSPAPRQGPPQPPCQRPRRRLRQFSVDAAARRRQGRQLRLVAGQTGSRIRLAVARQRPGHTGPRLVSGRQLRSARPAQGARHRALPRPPRIPPDASTFEPALGAYGGCRRDVGRADAAVGKGAQPAGARIAARCRGVELVGHPAQAPRVIIRDASPHPAECRDEERNIQ